MSPKNYTCSAIFQINLRNINKFIPVLNGGLKKESKVKMMYVGNSISKLQIQVATYVFELSAGNCHR
jgi:hypothetical protein